MAKAQIFLSFLIVCAPSVISTSGVLAQTPAPSPRLPSTGLRTTDQVLDQVCEFLKDQESFTVDMDVTYDNVLDSGAKVQYSAYQKLWIKKPNQLRSDYVGDERSTRFFYDGKSFTLQTPVLNFYATKAAPPTIDAALQQVENKYGITIPMSNLAASDPCAAVSSDIHQSFFVGTDMVNRVPMYHLLFTSDDRDFQIWITRDKQPLIQKVVITYKTLPGSPQYTAVLSNWKFKPQIPDNTFTFTPPADAIGIELLPPQTVSTPLENAGRSSER